MRLLEGYTALDLSGLRGQLCGKLLRDLGMDVLKIEPPGGDAVRRLGPFAHDEPNPEGSLRFAWLNAGKQSVVLDLTTEADRERLLGLVREADVLLESEQPGALAALGLDEARLRAANPALIHTSITGFGQEGPYRDYLSPDLVALAMGGILNMSGTPELPPVQAPETQASYFASLYGAMGTTLALLRRAADGQGRRVDISMQETLAYHEGLVTAFAYEGLSIDREGSQHPHVAPAEIFPTSDGYVYLFIATQHWKRFLACWPDHPSELDDDRWVPNLTRRAEAKWINARVSEFTRRYTREELVTLFQNAGIPCLPVNPPRDFMHDSQVVARGLFQPTHHPVLGDYQQLAFPILIDGTRLPPAPPPLLGEHTAAVLGGLRTTEPPRRPTPDPDMALENVRILSFTTGIAGPHAARALAQAGAEVLKLESRRGGIDSFRHFSPDGDLDASPRFMVANNNTLSVQLNLKDPRGLALLRELVAQSDVVMDNFGSDVLPRLGLGPDHLHAVRPDLIVLKMPGLGSTGPRAHWRTWGSTLNAFTGMTYLWNHPGQARPIGYQGVYPDYVAAATAPMLVFAALLYRQRTGRGVYLDMAQAEMTAWMLGVSFLEAAVNGRDPQPVGNDWPYAAPYGVYRCAGEDRWCVVAVETDAQWRALCGALGQPALADDPAYATLAARRERRAELDAIIEAWTRERVPHTVLHTLQAAGVPAGAVQRGGDVFRDPQLRARGFHVSVEHPRLGHFPLADVPVRLSEGRLKPPTCAPNLGGDNRRVFCELLGYSPAQLAAWQAEGVVD